MKIEISTWAQRGNLLWWKEKEARKSILARTISDKNIQLLIITDIFSQGVGMAQQERLCFSPNQPGIESWLQNNSKLPS